MELTPSGRQPSVRWNPISPVLFVALLFVVMLILLEGGSRLGRARLSKASEGERPSLSAIEGAMFAIFGLLMAFTFSAAKNRSWPHILGFTVITVIVVYVVLDVEYPRVGPIRLEDADQLLVNVRNHMK